MCLGDPSGCLVCRQDALETYIKLNWECSYLHNDKTSSEMLSRMIPCTCLHVLQPSGEGPRLGFANKLPQQISAEDAQRTYPHALLRVTAAFCQLPDPL
jgi:hypothetical protein